MLRARTGKLAHPMGHRVNPRHHSSNMIQPSIPDLLRSLECKHPKAIPLFHDSLTKKQARKIYRELAPMVHPDRKTDQRVNSTHFPLLVQKLEEFEQRKQEAERTIERQRERESEKAQHDDDSRPRKRARKATRCPTDDDKDRQQIMVVSSCLMKWGFSEEWGNEINFRRKLEEMGVEVSARKKGATHLVYGEHDRSEAVAEVLKGFQTGSGVVLVHEDALQKLIEDYFLQQVKC